MKQKSFLLTYLASLSEHSVRLLAVGLIPIFLALAFLLYAHNAPPSFPYGSLWLARSFAFWVDSVGISLLLLMGGVFVLDYSEKHDAS